MRSFKLHGGVIRYGQEESQSLAWKLFLRRSPGSALSDEPCEGDWQCHHLQYSN